MLNNNFQLVLQKETIMTPENYLNKAKLSPNSKSAILVNSDIVVKSKHPEKQQVAWELLCNIYDSEFTKHINLITAI